MSGPFSTAGDWEIDWAFDCSKVTTGHDWLIIGVYRQSEADPATASLFDTITPPPGPRGSGVKFENRPTSVGPPKGIFYLKVSSDCGWHILAKD